MNALAQSDLRHAYRLIKTIKESNGEHVVVHLGLLVESVERLCHVCQALSEEIEELKRK